MASTELTSLHPLTTGHPKAPNYLLIGLPCEQVGTNQEDSRAKLTVNPDEENTSRYQEYEKNANNQHGVYTDKKYEECKFTSIEVSIERFEIFESSLETIKGILTICEQDFPNGLPLLHVDDHLNKKDVLFAKSVQIFTTHQFRDEFDVDSFENTPEMTIDTVVKTIEYSSTFSLIVIDSSTQESVLEALQKTEIRNAGIVIVGNSREFPVLSNVLIRKTDLTNITTDVDSLLECWAFEKLKTVHSNLKRLMQQNTLAEHDKAKLQDVNDLIKAAFENIDIPADDTPDLVMAEEFQYPANITEVIEKIVVIPGVIMCLKKRGTLQIYIEKSATESDSDSESETKELIRHELIENSVNTYSFVYGKTTRLALHMSGDSVFKCNGTLGGFAKKIALPGVSVRDQRDDSQQSASAGSTDTVALVSRHVIKEAQLPLLFMAVDNNQMRVHNGQPTANTDILPVDVDEAFANRFDPKFRTESNHSMYSKLRKSVDIRSLTGKPVYIWGARTSPGRGILVKHDVNSENGLVILVRDRNPVVPFAQEGDSGAMVCYFDPRNRVVYAVAMLTGSMQVREASSDTVFYIAEILDDGLQKLSVANGCQFLIFEG